MIFKVKISAILTLNFWLCKYIYMYTYISYIFSFLINKVLRITRFKATLCCHSSTQSTLRFTDAGFMVLVCGGDPRLQVALESTARRKKWK